MKKLILLATTIFISNILFADISGYLYRLTQYGHPFGLEMGMTLEDVKKWCDGKEPVYVPRLYAVPYPAYKIEPTKENKTFPSCYASIHGTLGLFAVSARSCSFDNHDGFEEFIDAIVQELKIIMVSLCQKKIIVVVRRIHGG